VVHGSSSYETRCHFWEKGLKVKDRSQEKYENEKHEKKYLSDDLTTVQEASLLE